MQNSKRIKTSLITSIFCFLLMSLDFLLMPISNDITNKNLKFFDIFTGALFWGTLIAGTIALSVFLKQSKFQFKDNKLFETKKVGLITFLSNIPAIVADIVFAFSIIAFVFLMLTNKTSYFCFVALAILIFSFIMHCIFNGKCFNLMLKKGEK